MFSPNPRARALALSAGFLRCRFTLGAEPRDPLWSPLWGGHTGTPPELQQQVNGGTGVFWEVLMPTA